MPGFVVVAPMHVPAIGQSGCPWQQGSPVSPQQTPLCPLPPGHAPALVTHVSVAVLHSGPPLHWSTLYVLPPAP